MAKPKNGSGVEIIKCACINAFQDSQYGPTQRVHTVGNGKRTCTVCGNVKTSW